MSCVAGSVWRPARCDVAVVRPVRGASLRVEDCRAVERVGRCLDEVGDCRSASSNGSYPFGVGSPAAVSVAGTEGFPFGEGFPCGTLGSAVGPGARGDPVSGGCGSARGLLGGERRGAFSPLKATSTSCAARAASSKEHARIGCGWCRWCRFREAITACFAASGESGRDASVGVGHPSNWGLVSSLPEGVSDARIGGAGVSGGRGVAGR